MIYRKKNKNYKSLQLSIVFISVVIVVLGFLKVNFIQDSFRFITIPFVKVSNDIRLWIVGPHDEKISKLEDEIKQLKIDSLKKIALEEENIKLRNIIDSSITDDEEKNISKIITRPPYSPYDTLTLDKGVNGRVLVGSKVLYRDVFMGNVVDVSEDSSIVQLITSPRKETQVRISGSIEAVAIGQGGGRLSIKIPKDSNVEVGDVVTLPDSDIIIVGVVSHIVVDEIGSFKTLYVSLPVSLSEILFVEIEA